MGEVHAQGLGAVHIGVSLQGLGLFRVFRSPPSLHWGEPAGPLIIEYVWCSGHQQVYVGVSLQALMID